jgi:phage gpG-like protein
MAAYEIEFSFRNQRYNDAEKGLAAFAEAISADWDGSAIILSREMKSFLDEVAKALAERHGQAWPGGTSAQTLSKRSGKLVGSIVDSVRVTGTTMATVQGTIGSDLPYARIQEFGGTITPKKAKFLAIPLPAALNANGTPIKSSPRDWPNTFCAKSKAGNLLIFQRRGTQIIPLYVLKSSVYIPPRLGLKKTLDAGIPYFVERAMDQMVKNLQQGLKA